MELLDRKVVLYLTIAGFEHVGFLFGMSEPQAGLNGWVRKTDGFGIWLSVESLPVQNVIVIPWHFVGAIEFETGSEPDKEVSKAIGF